MSRFINLVILVLGLTMYVPCAFGAPITCVTDTLSDYESQGSCVMGQFTLTNFVFSDSGTGGPNLVPDTQIEVTPTIVSNVITLRFTPLTGAFSVGAGQTAQYVVEYQVIAPPPPTQISGQSIAVDSGTLTAEFCGNGTLVSAPDTVPVTCTGNNTNGIFPGRLQVNAMNSSPSLFPLPASTEDVRLVLDQSPSANATFLQSNTLVTTRIKCKCH